MTLSKVDFRVNQFSIFYDLLMSNAPEGYNPWFFPCSKNGKNPCPKAILNIDSTSNGSWHHESARLNKEQCIEHIKKGYNIGISARKGDPLIIGDIDEAEFLNQLPEDTLTTTSRKRCGGHFFGWNKDDSAKINLPTDYGELRSDNQYVLCCGSYVGFDLNNEKDKKAFDKLSNEAQKDELLGYYTIRNHIFPRPLSFDDCPRFFHEKTKENISIESEIKQKEEKKTYQDKEGKYTELFNLKVSDIVGLIPANKRTGHPLHDSDTDANFSLSKDGTIGHCWRHLVSLNAVQYLCVKAGYKKCEDAGTPHSNRGISKIKGDKKALEVAYQEALKMGLIKKWEGSKFDNNKKIREAESDKVDIDKIKKSDNFIDSFIWDETKVIENKVFPIDTHQDFLYYGLLLPREVDKKEKNKEGEDEVVGKEQILSSCLITSSENKEKRLIIITKRTKENYAIKFENIPYALPNRWKLKDIHKYVSGKAKKINDKELLDKITKQYEKYVYIRNPVWYKILAVWDIGTYLYPIFEAYPFIENRGIAGTGKTKTMTISSFISFNGGQIMVNPSEATLFRETDEIRGTKYFDEAEKLFVFNKQTKQFEGDVRTELINASYTKDAKVPRQEKIGNKFITKWYSPYSPTQLSSINGLYGATETRAITRICTKSPNNDNRGELEPSEDRKNPIWSEIRDECYRFALENWEKIKFIYNDMPKDIGLKRRDFQIWKPLLSILKFINEDEYLNVLKFAIELSNRRLDDLIEESSFDYMCLNALKITIESIDSKTIYVEAIKKNYCGLKGDSSGIEDPYLNRNISGHLDKLGFKELRDKDRVGSFFSITKDIFNEIVNPICPKLSFLSSQSSPSSHLYINDSKKRDDSMTISDDEENKEKKNCDDGDDKYDGDDVFDTNKINFSESGI